MTSIVREEGEQRVAYDPSIARATTKKRGRRPGESNTREALLAAAREQFAETGYERTTVRAIARRAGVDPALIFQFYGSKEGLFTAAVAWPFTPDEAVAAIADGPRSQMGRRLATFFTVVWDDPERRAPVLGMMRAATTSELAARLLRESLQQHVLGPVAERLALPDADLRMSLVGAQLVGVGLARYILRMEPMASLDTEGLVDLVAPVFQRYLTGKL
ncbi:MAG TPA: TetR family transcriptional regulator [Solirubrobacteraceae bacterium]|jgi:AcrR family transcriptional regulator|nr:TetR family transcriptional regulator [Solirubrobacteraceae bacterium]